MEADESTELRETEQQQKRPTINIYLHLYRVPFDQRTFHAFDAVHTKYIHRMKNAVLDFLQPKRHLKYSVLMLLRAHIERACILSAPFGTIFFLSVALQTAAQVQKEKGFNHFEYRFVGLYFA